MILVSKTAFLPLIMLCAAIIPAMAQIPGGQFKPISGLGGWQISANTGGSDECSARIRGQSVDVALAVNRRGNLLLMAGQPDWGFPQPMKVNFQLQIDDDPAIAMEGDAVINLVVSEPEKAVADRIKKADRLAWLLPDGRHEAKVTGLAKAVEAINACQPKNKPG